MLTTTALFTEFLVIGMSAWLWLLGLVLYVGSITVDELAEWLKNASAVHLGILALVTYGLGVLSETISFVMEKFVVGPTFRPHAWYRRLVGEVLTEHWLAAQEQIWKSEMAFREFTCSRLRVTISWGMVVNRSLAGIMLPCLFGRKIFSSPNAYLFVVAVCLLVAGVICWWVATIEYMARVCVAGQIKG